MTKRVILLHGIWNAKAWLGPLASRLRAGGHAVDVLGYPSVFGGPDATLPRLVARLADGRDTAIVGHSLGGMMAIELLRQSPDLPVSRVVCLGSPLCGSATARRVAARPWSSPALGRSGALLQRGFDTWDGRAAVGVVAGSVARGLGRLLASVDADSDGTVAVAETRLPGITDHCLVAASHSGLVLSPEAARQTLAFLHDGRFAR